MKIAFALFKYFPYGGLQLDTMRFVQESVSRGHEAVLFYYASEGEFPQLPGFTPVKLPLKSKSSHGRAQEFEKRFHQAVSEAGDFDVTFAMNRIRGCDFYFAADNCFADKLETKPLSSLLKLLPRYRIFENMEKGIFAPGVQTRIFCIARQQYEAYIKRYNTPAERLIPLPPGIPEKYRNCRKDAACRNSILREFSLSEDSIIVISVGANFKLKGFDRAVKVLAGLPENLRCRVVWLATGPDKPEKVQLLARELGFEKQLVFTGGRSDTEKLLSGCDMMLHLPYDEAAGSVIAEALACELPVLCSGNCGFADLAKDAGLPVVPEAYDEKIAGAMCADILEKLPDYQQKCAAYARNADFFGRAKAALDFMEKSL